jgi:hypothetical protein
MPISKGDAEDENRSERLKDVDEPRREKELASKHKRDRGSDEGAPEDGPVFGRVQCGLLAGKT